MPSSFSLCLVLAVTLLPSALAVIFAKGREQRFSNGYLEMTDSNFQLECIKWHNYFRKLHGAQPLQYSYSLAEYARRRAIQLATKNGSNFYPPGNYENEELENVSPAVNGGYYDFAQEKRYKQKKIKIHTTSNGYSTTTHTFHVPCPQ